MVLTAVTPTTPSPMLQAFEVAPWHGQHSMPLKLSYA